uniref:Cyclin-dependent kinase inhibitor domain-containing protein n=1 Tax=Kryptolebias marmoratus TaxID=37003 RepID=A0A3Q2ZK93_KRYMA
MMSIRRRDSVCRSLFGPMDHDQLRRDLELKLQEMSEQDSRRWNFNFQSDTPLSGKFEWEEMSAERAALTCQDCAQTDSAASSPKTQDERTRGKEERLIGTDQENCSGVSNAPRGPAEGTPVRRKRPKPAGLPRTDARITGKAASPRVCYFLLEWMP